MPYQIYFGKVLIKNQQTGQTKTVNDVIFNDSTSLNDDNLKKQVLKTIKPENRKNWKVEKLFKGEAIKVGQTIY
jgi:hypothetical protein